MSALPPKADISAGERDVRSVPEAAIHVKERVERRAASRTLIIRRASRLSDCCRKGTLPLRVHYLCIEFHLGRG
jgi:hypothetical protein